uniref:Uncharacterized protein n=1 Tax=Mus musculus TaxID=10090 RepID=Q8BRA4_MOUSE|nr:unnamed protein product [Mus musculus]
MSQEDSFSLSGQVAESQDSCLFKRSPPSRKAASQVAPPQTRTQRSITARGRGEDAARRFLPLYSSLARATSPAWDGTLLKDQPSLRLFSLRRTLGSRAPAVSPNHSLSPIPCSNRPHPKF